MRIATKSLPAFITFKRVPAHHIGWGLFADKMGNMNLRFNNKLKLMDVEFTDYMLTEIWIRPTITYGLVACFVTEQTNQ